MKKLLILSIIIIVLLYAGIIEPKHISNTLTGFGSVLKKVCSFIIDVIKDFTPDNQQVKEFV